MQVCNLATYSRLFVTILYTLCGIDVVCSADLGPEDSKDVSKRSFAETTTSPSLAPSPIAHAHKKQKREDVTDQSSIPSLSKEQLDFEIFHENDAHFYLPPVSTAMLKHIFDRPRLREFCLRHLSDIPNLSNIEMLRPLPEENIPGKIPSYFMFEGLKNQKKVVIFLARSNVEFFSRPLYEYAGLSCEWFRKEEHKLSKDVQDRYDILIYIDLVDINWNKPFSRNYHLHISDDEKTPKELLLDSPSVSSSREASPQRAFYKPYFMDCVNQPPFPFLNKPEVRHLSMKENLLYTLRHAYLFLSIPDHLKGFPEFQELYNTLDARDWSIQEWITHTRDAFEEYGWTYCHTELHEAWDFIEKLWPLGGEKPQNLDADSLMFIKKKMAFDRHYHALKEMDDLLNIPCERLESYLSSTSFPIDEYRREVCFRDKSEALYRIVACAQAMTIAKNLRVCLVGSQNSDDVLNKMVHICASDSVLPIPYDRMKKYGLIKRIEELLERVIPRDNSQTPSVLTEQP